MSTRSGLVRTCVAPVAATLCLCLAACSSGSSGSSAGGPTTSPSTSTSSTSSPSADATLSAHAAQQRLHRAIVRMGKSRHVLISTEISYGDTYSQQSNGRYEVDGHRYDGTVKQLTSKKPSGFEVFHRDGLTVLRLLSRTGECWWQAGGSPAASYVASAPPQLAALADARATGGTGRTLSGSLPLVPVSQVLETPDALRRDGFAPLPGARVNGTFVLRHGIVAEFHTTVARVLLTSGVTPPALNGADTWTMGYSLASAGPITDPPADQIVHVTEDDPRRQKLVAACTARSR